MFEGLQRNLGEAIKRLRGRGRITEANIRESIAEVKKALLDADVNYDVVEAFIGRVTTRSVGQAVLATIDPSEQIVKIVYDELVALMGPVDTRIRFAKDRPTVLMLCGLQGQGKTTTAANGTLATASTITSTINTTAKTALVSALNLTTTSDADFYKFVVPAGLGGRMTVRVQSTGLSLLAPQVTLYNGSQVSLTSATAGTDYDGATLTVTSTVSAGQTYYVRVAGANATANGTGRYALALGFGGVAAPTAASPTTQTAIDPTAVGGGQAVGLEPETRVNTTTTGSQTTSTYTPRSVAMDAAGKFVVVWTSYGQDGDAGGIYAQRFDALGAKLGAEFRVNATTAGNQHFPAVDMDAAGNFVVVWTTGYDYQEKNVFAQRFNSGGVAQGAEFKVNLTYADGSYEPMVAMTPSGAFVITWTGWDDSAGEVRGQRFDAAGTRLGGEFIVNTSAAGIQCYSSLDTDAVGNFVVVWGSEGQSGSGFGIYAQRYNASGVRQGGEFRVNVTTSNDQTFPDVGLAANGDFVVTWSNLAPDGEALGVFARRYTAAGVSLGSEFRVDSGVANGKWKSSVAVAGGGNFFITWDSWVQDTRGAAVAGQQFLADGTRQGTEFRINSTTQGDQMSMALNANGDAVIVWSGNGVGDSDSIFFQRYMVSYGGMNAMNAEPHGFDPDGCGCDDHPAEDPGCGCGTCSAAVAVAHPAGLPALHPLGRASLDGFAAWVGGRATRAGPGGAARGPARVRVGDAIARGAGRPAARGQRCDRPRGGRRLGHRERVVHHQRPALEPTALWL